jgi:hypothetical protein
VTTAEALVGAWDLSDWYMEFGADRIHPFGPDASGLLVYTDTGRVSVTLMEPRRPQLKDQVLAGGLRARLVAGETDPFADDEREMEARWFWAASGYMAYSGRFTLDGHEVVHHIDQSLYPEWIGTDLVRAFSLDGDDLDLTGEAEGITQHLRWCRVR